MATACKTCGVEKPDDQMIERRGKVIRLCRECLSNSIAKKGDGAKPKTTKSKRVPKAAAPPPPRDQLALTPTYGFNAHIDENDNLHVVQANADQSQDEIILSASEASVLFKRFAKFAKSAA